MDAVLTKCYQIAGSYYRVRIVPDPECESPREAHNTSLLVTWESLHASPDSRDDIPACLGSAIRRWAGGGRDFVIPVQPQLIRYCRTFAAGEIYAAAGLRRGTEASGGRLLADFDPAPGSWYDGIALVTKERWAATMGADTPHVDLAAEILRQELDTYNLWVTGETYGHVVERFDGDSWIDQDSCWGFIGDPEGYVLRSALETLPLERGEPAEIDEDIVRSAVSEKSAYAEDLESAIQAFRFELCPECGKDLDRHLIGPDVLGKPHLWCMDANEAPEFLVHAAVAAMALATTGWLSTPTIARIETKMRAQFNRPLDLTAQEN
jgi:hypothetical protein